LGAQPDLIGRFLPADIGDRQAARGDACRRLKQQGRFADAGARSNSAMPVLVRGGSSTSLSSPTSFNARPPV
jgi:hypothetical protein